MIVSGVWMAIAIAAALPWLAFASQANRADGAWFGVIAAAGYLAAAIAWWPWRAKHRRPIAILIAIIGAAFAARLHVSMAHDALVGVAPDPFYALGGAGSAFMGWVVGGSAAVLAVVSLALWRPDQRPD